MSCVPEALSSMRTWEPGSALVQRGREHASLNTCRNVDAFAETKSAGREALEAVDGRKAGLGIVEGQELAVHGAPAATPGR